MLVLDSVRWKFLKLAMVLATAGLPLVQGLAMAAERTFTEYDTKALFVINIIKMTEWPATQFAGPDAPYVIGILGKNPFGAAFKPFEGKLLKGRPVQVKEYDSAADARSEAHVLFVSATERNSIREIATTLAETPVLTVSDIEGFAERGGAIELGIENRKIVFEVNQTTASRAGLNVSSQVLKVARKVRK